MALSVLRRILYAIPVLLIASVIAFGLSQLAPGDPVSERIASDYQSAPENLGFFEERAIYERTARAMNAHLPAFYFAIAPASNPDTLHHIINRSERTAAKQLMNSHGNWPAVNAYRRQIYELLNTAYNNLERTEETPGEAGRYAAYLLITADQDRVEYVLGQIEASIRPADTALENAVSNTRQAFNALQNSGRDRSEWIPKLIWYGTQNRYHKWISGVIRGEFGTSLVDGRQATRKIGEAVRWTLRINIPAILLAFAISIPLGVASARRKGRRFDRIVSNTLFVFFAIPSFWLATLFIVFLTTSEYHPWLDLFPTSGVGEYYYVSDPFRRFGIMATHLFLPIICLFAGDLAYLTRQMRAGILDEIDQDYIRMARAKGVSEQRIYWKHAFKNALFPMITLLGRAIPASISGSVIIEVIFGIPGMGRLLYGSILARDWPVAYIIVLMVAVLTVMGYLLSDILYRLVNPRVEFESRRT